MTRGPCPVCGAPLRGFGEVIETRWLSVFSCARCGRFTADDDVLARVETADDAEREAISGLLSLRNEDHPRGVALRVQDLPPRLQG